MFDNIPSTVSPLETINKRRRSKSLDDLVTKQQQQQQQQQQLPQDRLSYYQDTCTPTSPVVTLKFPNPLPKRRHSLCAETKNREYIRLASIYGWVYTPLPATSKQERMHGSSYRHLKTSRSFSHIPHNAGCKFSRMFGRKTINNATLFPNKTIASITLGNTQENALPVWMNELDIKDEPTPSMQQQYTSLPNQNYSNENQDDNDTDNEPKPPPKPIENDPHVFDLLSKDSSLFIHYGKCDTTVTSATVEKLVEKLTREMDNDFLMDFFLTYRQFTTPIKLCKLLILRFRWALLEENDTRRLVRIRTFVVIRHWLTHYWTYDFTTSKTLRFMLSTFLTQLQTHPVILVSPRDERIIKNLRNVLKRQRKYFNQQKEDEDHDDRKSVAGIQTSRKDSAIALSSCRNSMQPDQLAPDNKWTSKVKRTLKRSVSQSTTSVARTSNVMCSCKSNNSSISNCSVINNSSSISTYCLAHPDPIAAAPAPSLIASSRLFLSHKASSANTPAPIYKSFILKFRSEIIAQQFCIIERNMLQKVTWDELVDLRWRKRSSKRQSYVIDLADLTNEDEEENLGIDRLIGFFNMTCQWVASEVVRSNHTETRIKVIEKLIRIALKCHQHRNYSTLMQILLGLQSPAVSRLTKTWQKVDHCQMELFNQLKEMAKPFRNWKNVRDCMTKATEEVAESFAVESVLTDSHKEVDHSSGCIPFLGLYLSDLVFVDELPTFIEPGCMDTTDDEDEVENVEDQELYERLSNHFVNYNKFRIKASVVKHVLAFQVLSRAYNFKTHTALNSQLESLSLLDNSQIRKASFLCEE